MTVQKIFRMESKACFLFLAVTGLFTILLTDELAIPGPISSVPKRESAVVSQPVRLRTSREMKMDTILSGFKTGLKSIENRRLIDFIHLESRRYGFDPELILALIYTESSFYNWSESKKGALGMMQIIPSTGREMAEIDTISWTGEKEGLFDPFLNVRLGIRYLHYLTQQFPDLYTALTAYNYGPTRVKQWIRHGEKMPTRYANRILTTYVSYLQMKASPENAT